MYAFWDPLPLPFNANVIYICPPASNRQHDERERRRSTVHRAQVKVGRDLQIRCSCTKKSYIYLHNVFSCIRELGDSIYTLYIKAESRCNAAFEWIQRQIYNRLWDKLLHVIFLGLSNSLNLLGWDLLLPIGCVNMR